MRFKRVVKAAKKDGYFRGNPTAELSVKQHPSVLKEVLEPKEYAHIIKVHWINYEVKKAAITCMYSGFR
jgi:hypothetical protein